MSSIRRFEDLPVHKAACDLDMKLCHAFTFTRFKYDLGLRSQALNSSGSCQDNIAEGFERGGNKEFIHFLRIAKASIGETRGQVKRAERRDLIPKGESEELIELCLDVSRQLSRFIQYLRNSEMKGERYAKEPDALYGTGVLNSAGIESLNVTDIE